MGKLCQECEEQTICKQTNKKAPKNSAHFLMEMKKTPIEHKESLDKYRARFFQ